MKENILIIDHEPFFREFALASLEATGLFSVSACSNSRDGVRLIRTLAPALVMLDVMLLSLSSNSGQRLLSCIRARDIPVIFLSSLLSMSDIGKAGISCSDGHVFLRKPVNEAEIISAVKSLIVTSPLTRHPVSL